jgi:hypothetical protein
MADLGATTYTSVTWTAGDILTEAKLDNMTANDQAYDSHAAQGLLLDNAKAYCGKDSGGTARNIAKVNASNQLEIGDSGLSGVVFQQRPVYQTSDAAPTASVGLTTSYASLGLAVAIAPSVASSVLLILNISGYMTTGNADFWLKITDGATDYGEVRFRIADTTRFMRTAVAVVPSLATAGKTYTAQMKAQTGTDTANLDASSNNILTGIILPNTI